MRMFLSLIVALIATAFPLASHATFISGDVTGGGTYSGVVTSSNSWVQSNPTDGSEVNFWTFTAGAGDLFSLIVESAKLEFGASLYFGLVEPLELLVPGFANDASFGDNELIAGTPSWGALGTSLLDIVLPYTGLYTIAVGGEGFGFDPSYAYDMHVNITPVPAPDTAGLFAIGCFALGFMRARRRS